VTVWDTGLKEALTFREHVCENLNKEFIIIIIIIVHLCCMFFVLITLLLFVCISIGYLLLATGLLTERFDTQN
jgi:hypothetical protein